MDVGQDERAVLCTAGSGTHAALLGLVRPMLSHYADLHGYDLIVHDRSLQTERPAAWDKIVLIRSLLEQYDTVVWVDADAAIVRHDVDIRSVADPERFFWMTMHHIAGQEQPNTGVLVVRRGSDADTFLKQVWAQTSLINHPWWEQAAILRLLGYDVNTPGVATLTAPTPWFEKVGWFPPEWNSIIEDMAQDPRVVHYAGRSQELRLGWLSAHRRAFDAAQPAPEIQPSSDVSVILPLSPGAPEHALEAIVSIANQSLSINLMIVDNGARLRGVSAAVAGSVATLWCENQVSVASAWDRAISATSGDLVVLMTSPVVLAPSALVALLRPLEDPHVAASTTTADANAASSPLQASVIACRRRDLGDIGGIPQVSADENVLADLCLQLACTGRQVVAVSAAAERRPAAVSGAEYPQRVIPTWLLQMCRQSYASSLDLPVQLPIREELTELLEARGLRGVGAEIGVQRGLFSHYLLSHWSGSLISIDPWVCQDSYDDCANVVQEEQENICQEACQRLSTFGTRSQIWRMTSDQASIHVANSSLDFVYLDARHDRESVTEDLTAWWPKVRAGGVVAGHDFLDGDLPEGSFGVRSAVTEFFAERQIVVKATFLDPPWFSWVVVVPSHAGLGEPGVGASGLQDHAAIS